jgi:SAM-dependent MidA family methyltransferase
VRETRKAMFAILYKSNLSNYEIKKWNNWEDNIKKNMSLPIIIFGNTFFCCFSIDILLNKIITSKWSYESYDNDSGYGYPFIS